MKILIQTYRWIFCRRFFYSLNLQIFDLCLRGIGILNYEGYQVSGEAWFLNSYLKERKIKTIIDVGANIDPYGIDVPEIEVFALEPNKKTYQELCKRTQTYKNIHTFPIGLSDKSGEAVLFDISKKGTALATLEKRSLEKLYGFKPIPSKIRLTTLDNFVFEHKIKHIDLLKIDTEGNEFKVLQGAKKTLSQGKIEIILFEFNETNVYGRVFMRDFYELLEGFIFYRLLPDGLGPLGKYRPTTHELFAFQNIVAIKDK